jgi:NAD(P)H dehydrogenase (quinone)
MIVITGATGQLGSLIVHRLLERVPADQVGVSVRDPDRANPDSLFAPARDHAATEAYLAASGTPFTSLRDGFHAATVPHLLGRALETGELVAPADGPVSWTTHADLGEAAAVILTDNDRVDSATPVLTAADAVDLHDVAGMLSELTGRTIRRVVVDDDEYVADLVSHGVPEFAARMFLDMFHAARKGEFAVTDPTLEALLGREPQPIRAVLQSATAGH